MKLFLIFGFALLIASISLAQSLLPERGIYSKLTMTNEVPEALLASRSAVIYPSTFTDVELNEIQKTFQQTGIDAVAYFDSDYIFAGPDFVKSFSDYFNNRGIRFLVLVNKAENNYELVFTKANGKKDMVEMGQPAWQIKEATLKSALQTVYQIALSSQKKQNFLINDFPEKDVVVKNFRGGRNEAFSFDIRVKKIAIPRWGDAAADQHLEEYLKANLSLKMEFVDPATEEKELLQQGFTLMLRYVHTRGGFAKELLGYDLSQLGNALNSVTYVDKQPQVKTLPANEVIYKFYFKNLEEGSAYLGKQWDADVAWQDALRNHIAALKATLNLY
jgi:hypothetical protein